MTAGRPLLTVPARWLSIYYAATPLFFILDFVFGAEIRAAALTQPGHRYAYYGFCLGCMLLARAFPAGTIHLAIVDSAVNILVLVLSVWLPIIGALDSVSADGTVPVGLTTPKLINFVMAGAVLVIGLHQRQAALRHTSIRRAT